MALVTAAIVLWNTVYLGRASEVLRRQTEDVPGASLAHLAPLGWRHPATAAALWGWMPRLHGTCQAEDHDLSAIVLGNRIIVQ